ncbi:MAG: DUF1501 domain-containing protein [Pseudomonadota bacterium]
MKALNRRMLLTGSLVLGATSLAMPRMAFAQTTGSKNLLLVVLRGAADGLAMLAPTGDPDFARTRAIALADYEGARKADSFFTIHPAFDQVGQAYAAGDALFVHAAATAYRERSHLDGQNMLETGSATPYAERDGWLNRLVGMMPDTGNGTPPKALAVAPTLPLALRGAAPASSYAPSSLPSASEDFLDRVARLYANDPQLGGLWMQALETQEMASGDGLRNLRDAKATGELAASLMREEDGARIGMIEFGGWDSHANQRRVFARQASQLDTALGAYRSAMGSAWTNTMVLVVTEFGRTVRFNGTGGTDHGTASAAIVMGGAVRGGQVLTDWPGMADSKLYEGRDLRPTIALESVLAGAVAEHFGLDPKELMPGLFPGHQANALSGIARA